MILDENTQTFLHPLIVKELQDDWSPSIKFNSGIWQDLADNLIPWEGEALPGEKIWCAHIEHEHSWVRFLIRAKEQNPLVEFVCLPGSGNTSFANAEFKSVRIELHTGWESDGSIVLDSSSSSRVHGQTLSLVRFDSDFTKGSSEIVNPPILGPGTKYCPNNPNRTGIGDYMGKTHPISQRTEIYWMEQLYPAGNYPGIFVHPGGRLVEEADYPLAIGAEHFHRYGGANFINYPKGIWPKSPWDCPDDQHLSIYCAINQWVQSTRDLGGILLSQLGARRFLRQIPGQPKGTTHHLRGADRGEGRPMKEGIEFWRTLKMIKDPVSEQVAKRVHYLYVTFKDWWKAHIQWPHYPYGQTQAQRDAGGASVGFAGVCYWSLCEVQEVLDDLGITDPELHYMLRYYEKWLFDQFFNSTLPGDRGWVVPYITFPDGSNTGPSSMGKYAWIGATNYVPQTVQEAEKMDGILALRSSIPMAFRS